MSGGYNHHRRDGTALSMPLALLGFPSCGSLQVTVVALSASRKACEMPPAVWVQLAGGLLLVLVVTLATDAMGTSCMPQCLCGVLQLSPHFVDLCCWEVGGGRIQMGRFRHVVDEATPGSRHTVVGQLPRYVQRSAAANFSCPGRKGAYRVHKSLCASSQCVALAIPWWLHSTPSGAAVGFFASVCLSCCACLLQCAICRAAFYCSLLKCSPVAVLTVVGNASDWLVWWCWFIVIGFGVCAFVRVHRLRMCAAVICCGCCVFLIVVCAFPA